MREWFCATIASTKLEWVQETDRDEELCALHVTYAHYDLTMIGKQLYVVQ